MEGNDVGWAEGIEEDFEDGLEMDAADGIRDSSTFAYIFKKWFKWLLK